MRSATRAFTALVVAQTLHSLEESTGRLWDSFPPARFVSGLVSENLERGFLLANIALISFGLWCVLFPVRRNWRSAVPIMWGWALVETVNGIGHPLWAFRQGGYTPGVITAPLLLLLAIALALRLRRMRA